MPIRLYQQHLNSALILATPLNAFDPSFTQVLAQFLHAGFDKEKFRGALQLLSDWNYPNGSAGHTRARKNGIGITAVSDLLRGAIVILYGYREAVGQH